MTTAAPVRKSEFVDSTPLLNDAAALRARAEADGFLFFRGLMPRDAFSGIRADLLGVVQKHGWIKAGTALMEGVIDREAINRVPAEKLRTDIGVSAEAYNDVQKLESVHRGPHHPNLLAMYRKLFGREVLVHPRHIVRMVTPHQAVVPTPTHQDFPLIQGTHHTWTCWTPIGDCPREMGSLTVLRGSHRLGYLPITPAPGAGGISAILCPGESDWVEGDFQSGDVLTFSSYTVHKALPCRVPDRIRLSFDVRYQPVDEVVEERSLLPHCDLTWEQIYAGWVREDLKYYWRGLPLAKVPFDDALMMPGRRIC